MYRVYNLVSWWPDYRKTFASRYTLSTANPWNRVKKQLSGKSSPKICQINYFKVFVQNHTHILSSSLHTQEIWWLVLETGSFSLQSDYPGDSLIIWASWHSWCVSMVELLKGCLLVSRQPFWWSGWWLVLTAVCDFCFDNLSESQARSLQVVLMPVTSNSPFLLGNPRQCGQLRGFSNC